MSCVFLLAHEAKLPFSCPVAQSNGRLFTHLPGFRKLSGPTLANFLTIFSSAVRTDVQTPFRFLFILFFLGERL